MNESPKHSFPPTLVFGCCLPIGQTNERPEGKKACGERDYLVQRESLSGPRAEWRRKEGGCGGASGENQLWGIAMTFISHIRELKLKRLYDLTTMSS